MGNVALAGAALLTLVIVFLPAVITVFARGRKASGRNMVMAELGWLAALAAFSVILEKKLGYTPDQAVLPFLCLLVAGSGLFLWRARLK